MKKTIVVLAVIICILSLNKHEMVRIPKESIRLRVIANSNQKEDQRIKREIVKNLSPELEAIYKFQTIEETRNYLQKSLPTFEKIVENTLQNQNKESSFHINYGKNIFPEKEYKGVIYEEGDYESLVVTLGNGEGENFWCVLFPPICFLEEQDKVEYKSFVKEIIDKYF